MEKNSSELGKVIKIGDSRIQKHLGELVRGTVEETLNSLLDAEADRICGGRRYERTAERRDTRAGSYQRKLHTQAGEVTLKVPKLRNLPFETSIIERYKRVTGKRTALLTFGEKVDYGTAEIVGEMLLPVGREELVDFGLRNTEIQEIQKIQGNTRDTVL